VIDVPPFERITFFRFIGFVNIRLQFFGQAVRGGPPVLFLLLRQFSSTVGLHSSSDSTGGSGVSHLRLLTLTAKNEYT